MVVSGSGTLSTFTSLFVAEDLESSLSSGTLTVFAPSDDAFSNIDEILLGSEVLQDILLYHLVEGGPYPSHVLGPGSLPTKQGSPIKLIRISGSVQVVGPVNKATITEPDALLAYNGLVHILDSVLFPENPSTIASAE